MVGLARLLHVRAIACGQWPARRRCERGRRRTGERPVDTEVAHAEGGHFLIGRALEALAVASSVEGKPEASLTPDL